MNPSNWIIIYGSPLSGEGFCFVGPFPSEEACVTFIEDEANGLKDEVCWSAELEPAQTSAQAT